MYGCTLASAHYQRLLHLPLTSSVYIRPVAAEPSGFHFCRTTTAQTPLPKALRAPALYCPSSPHRALHKKHTGGAVEHSRQAATGIASPPPLLQQGRSASALTVL
jgi:hypothetical protein